MKTIEYSPEGEAIADAKSEWRAREFLNSDQDHIHVSNETFINAIRVLVYEGSHPLDQVRFMYRGEYIYLTRGARFREHRFGFCDHAMNFLSRLLNPPRV